MTTFLKYICAFLLIFVSSFNTSSNDIKSINDLAYVIALGIDVSDTNIIDLSFQIAIPSSVSGGESSGSSSESSTFFLNSVDCSSIDTGINIMNSYVSKKIELSNCKAIVISEQVAENGISDYIYTLINKAEISPQCNIVISKCPAKNFLENSKPTLEKLAAKYYEIVPTSSEYTGFTDDVNLGDFFTSLHDSFRQGYTILGGISSGNDTNSSSSSLDGSTTKANNTPIKNASNLENIGLAVFSYDKLVGELNAIETISHLIVTNRLETCNITIQNPYDESSTIDLSVSLNKDTKNSVKIINGSPYITSNVDLEIRILSLNSNSKYLDETYISQIETYCNSYLESQISNYLYKTSKEFNSDIAGMGRYAMKYFLTYDNWTNYNWLENYKNAFFDVNVKSNAISSYLFLEV